MSQTPHLALSSFYALFKKKFGAYRDDPLFSHIRISKYSSHSVCNICPAPETPFGPGILVKFPNWAWQSFCPRSPSSKQIVNSSIIVSVRQMKVTKETSLDYSIWPVSLYLYQLYGIVVPQNLELV